MIGAKSFSKIVLFLGLVGISQADLKPTYAIYPVSCGESRASRMNSTKYCLNKVGGSKLEVFSIKKLRNGITVVDSEYYLVASSYDLERRTSDGLAQVIVPAQRRMRLEKAEVVAPADGQGGYTKLASVTFSPTNVDVNGQGQRIDKRKELVLAEPDSEIKIIRAENDGLSLKSGANFEESFSVESLQPQPVTRGFQ